MPRKYTEARKDSNKKWDAANLDRLSLAIPKGKKDVIKAHAESEGESVNAFINRAVDEVLYEEGERNMVDSISVIERKARRQLARQGYRLKKSRTGGSVYVKGVYEGENASDRGGYQILDAHTDVIEAGECFDLTLEDVVQWAAEEEGDERNHD